MDTKDLALKFSEMGEFKGYDFECQPIPGDVDVLQITVEDFEEIPCYVSVTDTQILCITYLMGEDEVNPETRAEMMEEMLELNIPMPLSSFSKIGERYVLFGALSINSSFDDMCQEIITLCENSVEAITALEEFLL
ncbi:MAG: DUF2170 family protein [Gammaproteobacteria bacterium]|nr:DUF2170 family protein [Gammaproteobacteria bacterium]